MSRRIATAVVRARWFVVAAWIGAAIACVTLLPTIREAQTGALGDLVPVDAEAIDAEQRSAELFAFPLLSRTLIVARDADRIEPQTAAAVARLVVGLNRKEVEHLGWIGGAYVLGNVLGPETFARERLTTLVIPLLFGNDVGPRQRTEQADGVVSRLRPVAGGATLGVTGVLPARDAQSDVIEEHLPLTEIVTLVFVLLAVAAFTRSLVAPLVNLAAVALAYLVSIRVVAAIGKEIGISVPSEVEPVVVALLFGVVTDYVLFSLARFRSKLADGCDGRTAAIESSAELLPILTACGLAVAAGCGALIVAELGFLRAFGPGVAFSVLIALLVSVTFVPACFALLGPRTLWPAAAGTRDRHEEPRSERLLRWTVRRPRTAIAVCLVPLAAMTAGAASIGLGNPIISGLPADSAPHQAYDQLRTGLAAGVVSPVVIIVERPGIAAERAALRRAQARLARRPGVGTVIGPASNPTDRTLGAVLARNGDAARFVVFLEDDPLGSAAVEQIKRLRADLDELLTDAGLAEAKTAIAGDTALVQETIERAADDLPRVVPAVLVAVALVLVALLRSLVAPLYLVALAVVAPLAATGLTVLLFQVVLGGSGITYFVPIAAGVLLVALGSDYNVFLVGRIWAEARQRPLPEAIVVGGAGAFRAISAAGIVLAASFAALALVPVQAFRELAFLVSAGLLVDAFIVRSVLVPAVIAIVGERSNWPGRTFAAQPTPAP